VSSNVAYQALLYNRTLGSPPTSHFGRIADATSLQSFFGSLGPSSPDRNDALMAWLLERYFVPETLLSDGRWLRDYFARRIGALAEGAESVEAFVPVADADRLIDSWIVKAPRSAAVRYTQPLDEALSEARTARAEARLAEKKLDAVLHSTSWRITAPLRRLSEAVSAGCEQLVSLLPARSQHEQPLERPLLSLH
jgi:hypothetical protein